MAVPKKKTSPSKRNMRRSHDRLASPAVARCKNCGQSVRPHHVCVACGHYKGQLVLRMRSKKLPSDTDNAPTPA